MKKLSIIIFAIAVALAVIFGIFAPNAEFNYLFGSVKYFSTSIIIALLALILFFTSGNETRESKIYISPDGEFDIKTPRKYTPLRINSFSKFTGRANMFGQRNLKEFRYNDGIIFVENSKGESLEAPLSQLTFSYKKDKNKMNDEWYVYQYKLSDNNGNKVQFNYHSMLFNDEEYDDILMLLSLSSTVKEGKLSKATKIADSVLSSANSISDMDIIEAVGFAREAIKEGRQINMAQIGSETKERLLKKVKEQNGIIDEEEKKKGIKGFFKKVTEWGLIAIGILYIIAVIIVNVEPLLSSDSEQESDSTELYTVNSDSETQESAEPENTETEDNLTATEENQMVQETDTEFGFSNGMNYFDGNMISKQGKRFPFKLQFVYDTSTGEISNAVYRNVNYGATIKLTGYENSDGNIVLEGNDGRKPFIIQFSGNGSYTGDAWSGDFHQDIELFKQ